MKSLNSLFYLLLFAVFVISCGNEVSVDAKVINPASSDSSNWYGNPDGLYLVVVDGLYGFIDDHGKIKIKPQFEKAGQFSEGLAYFEKEGYFGFINTKGEVAIPPTFKKQSRGRFNISINMYGDAFFKEGLAAIKQDGLVGYINKKGEEVIPRIYRKARAFSNGYAMVTENNSVHYINNKGENPFGKDFGSAGDFSENLANVSIDGKYGYIDRSGKMAIPAKFYYAGPFMNGYAVVKDTRESKVWKLIDESGKIHFEKEVLKMHAAMGDAVIFYEDRNQGAYDLKGITIVEPKFDLLIGFMGELAIAKKDSKEDLFGLINKKGEWVIPAKYDGLLPAGENMLVTLTKDKKIGYINFSGKEIWASQN